MTLTFGIASRHMHAAINYYYEYRSEENGDSERQTVNNNVHHADENLRTFNSSGEIINQL